MRKRDVFDGLVLLVILGLSAEIVVRRWALNQVPAQFGASWVYALLAGNLLLAGVHGLKLSRFRAGRRLARQTASGLEKNG